MPVLNINMYEVTNKKIKGCAAAHDLSEHFLQGAGREFLTIVSRPQRSEASGQLGGNDDA